MPEFLAPGVFVEEVSFGARPIEGVSTSTTFLLGVSPTGTLAVDTPTLVTSFAEFTRANGELAARSGEVLSNSVRGFFDNGGSRAFILRMSDDQTAITPQILSAADGLEDISLVAAPGFSDPASHEALISHCEERMDRFAVLDLPQSACTVSQITQTAADGGTRPRDADRGVAAVYAPWITVRGGDGAQLTLPPSGYICGLYADSDVRRGVHKAPANLLIRGAISLTADVNADALNAAHVNPLRMMHSGIRVWGARTLASHEPDYRYVSVRRLAIYLEKSISKGIGWAVFEPNDEPLWKDLQRGIGAFLHTNWRNGAFQGAQPEEAFFVRVGRDTMTQADIDNGRLICEVGIAPLRPAEFVILRISQRTADSRNGA